ncbi:SWIM zinc finger family protein [Streptomyces sp. NPDC051636]|uniref:SWIM zinc finger family protein n=1 Tax=Streptomyces sp. NPDC051636 TaxID=3365663 RepID=UPI0037B22F03
MTAATTATGTGTPEGTDAPEWERPEGAAGAARESGGGTARPVGALGDEKARSEDTPAGESEAPEGRAGKEPEGRAGKEEEGAGSAAGHERQRPRGTARDEEQTPKGAAKQAAEAAAPEEGRTSGATAPEGKQAPDGTAERAVAAPGRDASRPGDAARAALRSAVAARRGAWAVAEDGAGPAERAAVAGPVRDTAQEAGDRPAPETAPESRDPLGPGQRPGDVAREALRAARRAAARSQAGPETGEAEPLTGLPSPGGPPAPSGRPGTARREAPQRVERSRVARDMREFLAGAFRMPSLSDVDDPADPADAGDPVVRANAAGLPDRSPTGPSKTRAPSATPSSNPPVPPTMATPHRDHDLRRTFPAFPPRPSEEGARFAATWWGNAWVEALEQGALDGKRLARGRGYAEQGHVDAITVTPGLVLAYVRGSRPRPYRVQVRLRTLEEADWARFLDAAADRPGHIAALLDKELPHSLADCGVPLLPGPGDLAPRCSCPDSGHPCKHAAALCYQTARLLDADPFVLLLLRGRGERDLLDALSRRNAARAARAAQERQPASFPGVRATDALAPRELPALPPPLPAPPHPQQPPVYPAAPGGPDPFALDQLATDAAARAHALLTTGRDPVGELTLWQDAVRQAAARPGSGLTAATRALYSSLASAAGRTPAELARAVAAWRQGGLEGLTVLEEPWDPPAGRFDRARPLLLAAGLPAFRPWRNRLTHPRGHVQLRLGRDGLWYAYESEPGRDDWWPRGTPDLDPVGALTGLGGPGET